MGGLVNISHLIATRLRRGETARRSLAASLLVLYRNPFGLKPFDLATAWQSKSRRSQGKNTGTSTRWHAEGLTKLALVS